MLGVSTSAGREFAQEHRLEENIYRGEYLRQWEEKNKKLVEKYKNNLEELGRRMAKDFLNQMIKPVIRKFGLKFDKWFSEKSLYSGGAVGKILKFFKAQNLVYAKDSALWFRAKNFGDTEDRVLVKSDGEMTYFLSDLAYHWNKFSARRFSQVIDVWGADHYGYLARVKAGLRALKIPEDKLAVIVMQLVRLIENGREIKMSKRAGAYVTLDELIDEVGSDVAKFFFLLSSPDSHMDFDLALAREKSEKNPVYYVQYAHARICSILKKSKIKKHTRYQIPDTRYQLLNHPSELALLKELDYFPELVHDIARNYGVHKLTHYAIGLAKLFHAFYRDCRVVGEEKELREARLALVLATQTALKNLLALIGVSAPEKM
jgi:arginyl-tRNA synthetase